MGGHADDPTPAWLEKLTEEDADWRLHDFGSRIGMEHFDEPPRMIVEPDRLGGSVSASSIQPMRDPCVAATEATKATEDPTELTVEQVRAHYKSLIAQLEKVLNSRAEYIRDLRDEVNALTTENERLRTGGHLLVENRRLRDQMSRIVAIVTEF